MVLRLRSAVRARLIEQIEGVRAGLPWARRSSQRPRIRQRLIDVYWFCDYSGLADLRSVRARLNRSDQAIIDPVAQQRNAKVAHRPAFERPFTIVGVYEPRAAVASRFLGNDADQKVLRERLRDSVASTDRRNRKKCSAYSRTLPDDQIIFTRDLPDSTPLECPPKCLHKVLSGCRVDQHAGTSASHVHDGH